MHQFFSTSNTPSWSVSPPVGHDHAPMFLARQSIQNGDLGKALELITPALPKRDQLTMDTYADLLFLMGEYESAFSIWEDLGDEKSLDDIIKTVTTSHEKEVQILALHSLYNIDPEKYTSLLVDRLRGQKQLDGAVSILNRSIEDFSESPEQTNWLQTLGAIYQEQQLFPEAEAIFQSALERDPNNWKAWLSLGRNYFLKDKDFGKALDCFEKAISIEPTSGPAYNAIGNLYSSSENWGEAIKAYQAAVKFNPEERSYRFSLASAYSATDQFASAIKVYQEIIRQNRNDAYAFFLLSEAYWLNQQPLEAIGSIESSLQLDSSNASFLITAGNYYEQQGLREKALIVYQAVVTIDPQNQVALAALARLGNSN